MMIGGVFLSWSDLLIGLWLYQDRQKLLRRFRLVGGDHPNFHHNSISFLGACGNTEPLP